MSAVVEEGVQRAPELVELRCVVEVARVVEELAIVQPRIVVVMGEEALELYTEVKSVWVSTR